MRKATMSLVFVLLAAACGASDGDGLLPVPAVSAEEIERLGAEADAFAEKHMGVATCAASQCHGSAIPRDATGVLQNEYVTWTQADPHSRAYEVLSNEQSRRIAARLGIGRARDGRAGAGTLPSSTSTLPTIASRSPTCARSCLPRACGSATTSAIG